MLPGLELRHLDRDEWKVLRDARLNALGESPQAFLAKYDQEQGYDQRRWRTEFDRGEWFIGELSDRHVCLAGVTCESDPPRDERYLEYVWVAPDFRRHHIAFYMLTDIIEKLEKLGVRTVFLWILDGNDPARLLYERLGFITTNHRQELKSDPGRYEERLKLGL